MSTSRHGTSQRDQVLRLEELRGLLDATKPQRQVRSRRRRRRRSSASAQCVPATMLALCSCPVASAVLVQCYVCVFALLSVL